MVRELPFGHGCEGAVLKDDVKAQYLEALAELSNEILKLIDALAQEEEVDKPWLSIATTDLQKGLLEVHTAIHLPSYI